MALTVRQFDDPLAQTDPSPVFGTISEIFDANDRTLAAASYRAYRHQPTLCRAPSGDLLMAMRAGASHSGADDAIAIIRSVNNGLTWSDRITEVTFSNDATYQEIASISCVGSRIWIIGCDVDVIAPIAVPSRTPWSAYSDDDGVTWTAKSYNVVTPGTNFNTAGGGSGIYEAANGDLLYPMYTNDIGETRYTSRLARSTDGGATFPTSVIVAQSSIAAAVQYEEPWFFRIPGTSRHIAVLRVDNDPVSAVDPNRGTIFISISDDDAVTWSAPTRMFDGRGTTPIVQLKSGTLVCVTRGRGQTSGSLNIGFRGLLYWSTDLGTTWEGGEEFQFPLDGPDGPTDMVGQAYFGADIIEIRPNVIGVASSQETTNTANQFGGLYWREIAFHGAPLATYEERTSALRFPDAGGAYLDYGTTNLSNGNNRFIFTCCFRYVYSASGQPWATADQVLFSKRITTPSIQNHLIIGLSTTGRVHCYLATGLTTNALWVAPNNPAETLNGAWVQMTVFYNGAGATNADRLQVFLNTRQETGGTFTGTMPASLTSPTTATWQVGASAGGSTSRSMLVRDIAFWNQTQASAITMPNSRVAELFYNQGAPRDYREIDGISDPTAYFIPDRTNSTMLDDMGSLSAPTQTGTLYYSERAGSVYRASNTATFPTSLDIFVRPERKQLLRGLTGAAEEAVYNPSKFGRNKFAYLPQYGTALGRGYGMPWDNGGATPTISHPAPSSASFENSFVRTQIVSGTSAAQTAGIFSGVGTNNRLWRGNAVGLGGFLVKARWCRRNGPDGSRGGFILLQDFGPDFEPSQGANSVGFSYDSTDTTDNYFVRARNGVLADGLSSSTDLGLYARRDLAQVYEGWIFAYPNDTEIHLVLLSYATRNLLSPRVVYSGAVSTNIPANNVFLSIELNASPGPLAGAPQVAQTLDVHWINGLIGDV